MPIGHFFGFLWFFLLFLAVFVAGVSYLSGASPAQILLRTGIGILVAGVLLWTFNWRLTSSMIEAAYADQNSEERKARQDLEQPLENGANKEDSVN